MSEKLRKRVSAIIRDAGGTVVGRTKLQKLTYLLVAAGLEDEMPFLYKHYGPYCEDLSIAAREAHLYGLLKETEVQTDWGGTYSIYSVNEQIPHDVPPARRQLAKIAAGANAVELELVATALFLAGDGFADNAWSETERRKPEKATDGRLAGAKKLYREISEIRTLKLSPQLG